MSGRHDPNERKRGWIGLEWQRPGQPRYRRPAATSARDAMCNSCGFPRYMHGGPDQARCPTTPVQPQAQPVQVQPCQVSTAPGDGEPAVYRQLAVNMGEVSRSYGRGFRYILTVFPTGGGTWFAGGCGCLSILFVLVLIFPYLLALVIAAVMLATYLVIMLVLAAGVGVACLGHLAHLAVARGR